MTSLGSLIVLLAAVFFIYPLAVQRTTSECVALGRLAGAKEANAQVGAMARKAEAADLPRVPAPVGCAWLYWRSILNGGQS